MNRGQNTKGGRLLFRIACFFYLVLLSFGQPAAADSAFDVRELKSSTSLLPYRRSLTTEQPGILVQMPPNAQGNADVLELKSSQGFPPFQWNIFVLTNTSAVPRELVLTVNHQKFAGSGFLHPNAPGSVVLSMVQTGAVQPPELSAPGEDAYGFVIEPSSSKSIAIQIAAAPQNVVLWDRVFYDQQTRSSSFFRGAILGIAMLLGLSMVLLYTARARSEFISGSLFAAAALAFMLLETGYFPQSRKVLAGIEVTPAEVRGVAESLLAISLLFFLTALPDLRRTSSRLRNALLAISALGLLLPVYGFVDPLLTATIARAAFAAIAIFGLVILYRLRRDGTAETAFFMWLSVVIWSFVAAIAMFLKGGYYLVSPLLVAGLAAVLTCMVLRFVKYATGSGFLSQPLFHEAGRSTLALAGARQYVWDWNPGKSELFVSEELEQALGHLPRMLYQSNAETLLDMMHPADRLGYTTTLGNAELHGRGAIRHELRLRRADGTYRWFELRARGIANSDNRMIRCIGTLSDITGAKRAEERLLIDAVYDQVTGLPNRALFLDRLKRELAKQFAENTYVILIDLDRFKKVNDGLGHEAGDSLLNTVGRRIEQLLTPDDTVARLPGDQFAVLFSAVVANRDIAAFVDQARAAIARPISANNQEVFLTACFGISSYSEAGLSADQLMKDAAIAVYEAKRRGKESVEFFQPHMRDNRGELVALESELRRAVERNEIEVHYQPIARLSTMDLAGFEALVRWRHPELGLLAPESFLGLAEQTGMIKDIGRFVLNEATHQLGIWQRAFKPSDPIFMAVNISASQLAETDIVLDVRAVIAREGIFRHTLKIEVTESVVMQFPEKAANLLDQVRQLGVGLSCDDFGTGYSSLSSLRNLPFDTIKVDRSFITPEPDDEKATIILEAIVALAHDLGLAIVVEGIEDQAQVDRLGAMHCDYGQGFFIGLPMTARQVTESLAAQPYGQNQGKTVISTLWERATEDPVTMPSGAELTTDTISDAIQQRERELTARNLVLAERAKRSVDMLPLPGAAPMAPRLVKLEPMELPPLFDLGKSGVRNPVKPKRKAPRKPRPKKATEEPSGVA